MNSLAAYQSLFAALIPSGAALGALGVERWWDGVAAGVAGGERGGGVVITLGGHDYLTIGHGVGVAGIMRTIDWLEEIVCKSKGKLELYWIACGWCCEQISSTLNPRLACVVP